MRCKLGLSQADLSADYRDRICPDNVSRLKPIGFDLSNWKTVSSLLEKVLSGRIKINLGVIDFIFSLLIKPGCLKHCNSLREVLT